jgi:hypothetical protein
MNYSFKDLDCTTQIWENLFWTCVMIPWKKDVESCLSTREHVNYNELGKFLVYKLDQKHLNGGPL